LKRVNGRVSSLPRWALLLGVSAAPVGVLASGCAAIVGLDETYPLVDGGHGATDATPIDGSSDARVLDAADSSADGASPPDSSAPPGWQLDTTFADGGYQLLQTFAYQDAAPPLPVIDHNEAGVVHVAYAGVDGVSEICVDPFVDEGCVSSSTGSPIDLLSNSEETVYAANGGTSVLDPGSVSVVAPGGSQIYPTSDPGFGIRVLSVTDDGVALVAAFDGSNFDVVSFTPATPRTQLVATFDAGTTSATSGASATLGTGGNDVWAVGCSACGEPAGRATYFHGSMAEQTRLAAGSFGDGVDDCFASDFLASSSGGLLVGGYTGMKSGFLAAVVPSVNEADAAAPSPPLNQFDLDTGVLRAEPAGHTRIVTVQPGVNVVVGTLASVPRLALLTLDDQGHVAAGWPTTPQVLTLPLDPQATSLSLGGVTVAGGKLYAVLEATNSAQVLQFALVRLAGTP
jgi:hypothetical protein